LTQKSGISIISDQSKNTDQTLDDICSICLREITDKKTLSKCGHSFCAACIDEAFKHQKKCPVCSQVYGPSIGNQPPGEMTDSAQSMRLLGFESCGTIVISYTFDGGVQGKNHPNPGQRYTGTQRRAYLPDNKEGRKVLKLLRKAFDQKLTFTIGRSSTTGANNVITWNGIHHKTSPKGGPTRYVSYFRFVVSSSH
jgi:deltex-like protein